MDMGTAQKVVTQLQRSKEISHWDNTFYCLNDQEVSAMSKTVHIESLRNDCSNFLLNTGTFSTHNSGSIISLTNKIVDVNTDLFHFILNSITKAFSG
jgi:hypothetical protein